MTKGEKAREQALKDQIGEIQQHLTAHVEALRRIHASNPNVDLSAEIAEIDALSDDYCVWFVDLSAEIAEIDALFEEYCDERSLFESRGSRRAERRRWRDAAGRVRLGRSEPYRHRRGDRPA